MATGENILDNVADATAGADQMWETNEQLEIALASLGERFPRCGKIFAGILTSLELGGGPREVSQRALEVIQQNTPEMTQGGFYTALHRCRAQLRAILEKESGDV